MLTMVLMWWVLAHGNSPSEFSRIGHMNMVTGECVSGKNPGLQHCL